MSGFNFNFRFDEEDEVLLSGSLTDYPSKQDKKTTPGAALQSGAQQTVSQVMGSPTLNDQSAAAKWDSFLSSGSQDRMAQAPPSPEKVFAPAVDSLTKQLSQIKVASPTGPFMPVEGYNLAHNLMQATMAEVSSIGTDSPHSLSRAASGCNVLTNSLSASARSLHSPVVTAPRQFPFLRAFAEERFDIVSSSRINYASMQQQQWQTLACSYFQPAAFQAFGTMPTAPDSPFIEAAIALNGVIHGAFAAYPVCGAAAQVAHQEMNISENFLELVVGLSPKKVQHQRMSSALRLLASGFDEALQYTSAHGTAPDSVWAGLRRKTYGLSLIVPVEPLTSVKEVVDLVLSAGITEAVSVRLVTANGIFPIASTDNAISTPAVQAAINACQVQGHVVYGLQLYVPAAKTDFAIAALKRQVISKTKPRRVDNTGLDLPTPKELKEALPQGSKYMMWRATHMPDMVTEIIIVVELCSRCRAALSAPNSSVESQRQLLTNVMQTLESRFIGRNRVCKMQIVRLSPTTSRNGAPVKDEVVVRISADVTDCTPMPDFARNQDQSTVVLAFPDHYHVGVVQDVPTVGWVEPYDSVERHGPKYKAIARSIQHQGAPPAASTPAPTTAQHHHHQQQHQRNTRVFFPPSVEQGSHRTSVSSASYANYHRSSANSPMLGLTPSNSTNASSTNVWGSRRESHGSNPGTMEPSSQVFSVSQGAEPTGTSGFRPQQQQQQQPIPTGTGFLLPQQVMYGNAGSPNVFVNQQPAPNPKMQLLFNNQQGPVLQPQHQQQAQRPQQMPMYFAMHQ